MMARVLVVSGKLKGQEFPIEGGCLSIGRRDDNDLVIPEKFISREHAQIEERQGHFVLRSLSEKNPVLVNRRAVQELRLRNGDRIEICGIKMKFALMEGERSSSSRPRRKQRESAQSVAEVGETVKFPHPGERLQAREGRQDAAVPERGQVIFDDSGDVGSASGGGASGSTAVAAESDGTGEIDMQRVLDGGSARPVGRSEVGELDDLEFDDEQETVAPPRSRDTGLSDKAVRALIGISGVGIFVALAMVVYLNVVKPVRVFEGTPFNLHQQESRVMVEDWTDGNPLAGLAVKSGGGDVAEEWRTISFQRIVAERKRLVASNSAVEVSILLHLENKTHLLVTARKEGRLRFSMAYQNGDRRVLTVEVRGLSKRMVAAEKLRQQLEADSRDGQDLRIRVRSLEENGDELWRQWQELEREVNAPEALRKYVECIVVLRVIQSGLQRIDDDMSDTDIRVNQKLRKRRRKLDQEIDLAKARFKAARKNQDTKAAKSEIDRLIALIGDPDHADHQRYTSIRDILLR